MNELCFKQLKMHIIRVPKSERQKNTRNNVQIFSKFGQNYKPIGPKSSINPNTRNMKKYTKKAHHNQIAQKQG